jgi:hypothetical protein
MTWLRSRPRLAHAGVLCGKDLLKQHLAMHRH